MDYSKSWTRPGQGFEIKEGVKFNIKPDNPKAQVGDATNRRTEYSHVYVEGLDRKSQKRFVTVFSDILDGDEYPFSNIRRFLLKDNWGKVGKNRNDVVAKGRSVIITNAKQGHLGASHPDVAMVIKTVAKWCEVEGSGNVKIGSVLHDQR